MLSFKPAFLLSSCIFFKRFFKSSLLSAIRVVSSAYLKLLTFFLAIFIPICFIQPHISHDVQCIDDTLCMRCESRSLCPIHATHGLYSPWNSPGQNTGVRSHSLLQGIFPTQGLNAGLLCCRRILYHLSHQESLKKYHQIRLECMSSMAVPVSARNTTYFTSLVVPCQICQGCILSPCLFSLYAEYMI